MACRSSEASRHRLAAWRPLHFACVQAARADLYLLDLAVDDRAHDLEVWLPRAASLVVRVRDVVAERDALTAGEAAISLNSHGLSPLALDQLDARHLGAVTLAVAGLENARIAAVASRELGTDLLKELVRGFALVNVATGEPAG